MATRSRTQVGGPRLVVVDDVRIELAPLLGDVVGELARLRAADLAGDDLLSRLVAARDDDGSGMTDTQLVLNGALFDGGAVYREGAASGYIARSLFRNNVAQVNGGGLWTTGQQLFIGNSTFSANAANQSGSAMYVLEDGEVRSWGNTIAFNVASVAIAKYGDMQITNTLLASFGEDNCLSSLNNILFESLGGNLSDDTTCEGLDHPTDQTDVPTLIAPLADNGGGTRTHALLDGSPAIDNAVQENCGGKVLGDRDQRLAPRPDGFCDIGAHEQGAIPPDSIFADGFELSF